MSILWLVAFFAVLASGAAGWALVRARQARSGAPVVPAGGRPALAAAGAPPDALRRGDAAPGEAGFHSPDVGEIESGSLIFQGLCDQAWADATPHKAAGSASGQAAAEAAAIDVLGRIDAHPRYVPRRPQLLPQLTRAINDPAASAQAIAAILAQDPALAGNLLRIANSALYRRRGAPIEQLDRAVALLGTEGLRQTVMAALLQPVITDDGSVFARCAALLWDHSLLSATIAMHPTQGTTRDDQHAAQLLALLLGLGSVVVVQVLRDAWTRRAEGAPDAAAVGRLLETWSVRCARSISADWGLSARVREALDELADDFDAESMGELGRTVRRCRGLALTRMRSGGSPASP